MISRNHNAMILAGGLGCLLSTAAAPAVAENYSVPTSAGQPLGEAYNALTGQLTPPCVQPKMTPAPFIGATTTVMAETGSLTDIAPDGNGYNTKVIFKFFNSAEDLVKSLDANAAARFGMGAFKGGASFSISNQHTVSRRFSYLLISIVVAKFDSSITFVPKEQFKKLALRNPASFYKSCGTHYLQTGYKSAEFTAIVESKYFSEGERSSLQAAIYAKYGSASGTGSITSEQQRLLTSSSLIAEYLDRGPFPDSLPKPTDIGEIIDYAFKFPEKIKNAEKEVQVVCATNDDRQCEEAHRRLTPWNQSTAIAVPYSSIPLDVEEYHSQQRHLSRLAEQFTAANEVLSDIETSKDSSDLRGLTSPPVTLAKLQEYEKNWSTYADALVDAADKCGENPITQCLSDPSQPALPDLAWVEWKGLPLNGSVDFFLSEGKKASLLVTGNVVFLDDSKTRPADQMYQVIQQKNGVALSLDGQNIDPSAIYEGPRVLVIRSQDRFRLTGDEKDTPRAGLVLRTP